MCVCVHRLVCGADSAFSAQHKTIILLESLRVVDPETLFASIEPLLRKAMEDTTRIQATLREMSKYAVNPEGEWLLKTQLQALLLSGTSFIEVRNRIGDFHPGN